MGKQRVWRYALPVVMFGSGLLFATTATTAHGTDLRAGRRTHLTQLINQRAQEVAHVDQERGQRSAELERATRQRARTDERIAQPQAKIDESQPLAGLTPVKGPAVTVILTDAPRSGGKSPIGATPDDLVVHQQDVQAVMNALWSGGAEAMTIMSQRVVATSAVRCVGNTLLLHGRTYSPPFQIVAIGNQSTMVSALDRSPGVQLFRTAAKDYGLGYHVTVEDEQITLSAYQGSTNLPHTQTNQ
jgi:uncharacterized protein YlxW (UPF0749 family)